MNKYLKILKKIIEILKFKNEIRNYNNHLIKNFFLFLFVM